MWRRFLPALLLLSCLSLAARDPVMTARLAFDPSEVRRTVVPVIVDLVTHGEFRGEILVVDDKEQQSGVVQPLNVGQGKFRFELPYSLVDVDLDRLRVLLRDRTGREVTRMFVPLQQYTGPPWTSLWAVAADKPGVASMGEHDYRLQRMIIRLRSRDFLDDWRCYMGLSVLVIHKSAVKHLDAKKAEAIADFVRVGGLVLVNEETLQADRKGYLAKAFTLPGEQVGRQRLGSGYVRILPDGMSFREVQENHHSRLCDRSQYDEPRSVRRRFRSQDPMPDFCGDWLNLPELEVWHVLVFLAVFAVIVTFVDRLFLRLIKRQHYTWFTSFILIALFCWGAVRLNVLIRGVRAHQASIVVQDWDERGRPGALMSINCYVPARGHVVEVSRLDGVLTPYEWGNRWGESKVSFTGITNIRDGKAALSCKAWKQQVFETWATHQKTSPFTIVLSENESGSFVEIDSSIDPSLVYVVRDNAIHRCQKREGAWRIGGGWSGRSSRRVSELDGIIGDSGGNFLLKSVFNKKPMVIAIVEKSQDAPVPDATLLNRKTIHIYRQYIP